MTSSTILRVVALERVGHEEYTAEKKRVRKRNVRWDFGTGEEAVLQPRERFRVENFISIMDSMLGALQHRLNAYDSYLQQLQLPQQPQHIFK